MPARLLRRSRSAWPSGFRGLRRRPFFATPIDNGRIAIFNRPADTDHIDLARDLPCYMGAILTADIKNEHVSR